MKNINEYSKSDFIKLIEKIISAEGGEKHQDEILELFIKLSEHPSGSDLIYYPEPGDDPAPVAIAEKIQHWRKANGKPGLKD